MGWGLTSGKGTWVGMELVWYGVVRRPSCDTIVLNLGPAGAVLCVLWVRLLQVLPALRCQRALA